MITQSYTTTYGPGATLKAIAQGLDRGIDNLLQKNKTEFQREVVSRAVATVGVGAFSALGVVYNALAFCVKLPIATAMGLQSALTGGSVPRALHPDAIAEHLGHMGMGAVALISLPVTVSFATRSDLKGVVYKTACEVFGELPDPITTGWSPWRRPSRIWHTLFVGGIFTVALALAARDLMPGWCGGHWFNLNPAGEDKNCEDCVVEQCQPIVGPRWTEMSEKCKQEPNGSGLGIRNALQKAGWGFDVLEMDGDKYSYGSTDILKRVTHLQSLLDPNSLPQVSWCQETAYDLCKCIMRAGRAAVGLSSRPMY